MQSICYYLFKFTPFKCLWSYSGIWIISSLISYLYILTTYCGLLIIVYDSVFHKCINELRWRTKRGSGFKAPMTSDWKKDQCFWPRVLVFFSAMNYGNLVIAKRILFLLTNIFFYYFHLKVSLISYSLIVSPLSTLTRCLDWWSRRGFVFNAFFESLNLKMQMSVRIRSMKLCSSIHYAIIVYLSFIFNSFKALISYASTLNLVALFGAVISVPLIPKVFVDPFLPKLFLYPFTFIHSHSIIFVLMHSRFSLSHKFEEKQNDLLFVGFI